MLCGNSGVGLPQRRQFNVTRYIALLRSVVRPRPCLSASNHLPRTNFTPSTSAAYPDRPTKIAPSALPHPIHRLPAPPPATVQDVRVDHRGAHVAVAEQFLDRSNVVPILEQVGRER